MLAGVACAGAIEDDVGDGAIVGNAAGLKVDVVSVGAVEREERA